MRIPIIVISPWVKPHYVSHTWRDLTSILRLIETRFNVPPLTARDATADNMMEFFDFSSPRLLTPPPLPNQPTNGTCNFQLEKAPGY
jgi:phospholipase C